jgi:anaerobic ribonucleoside-triphosphate reductase
MKATLTFNLPEERAEYEAAVNGQKYKDVIDEILQDIRKELKYNDKLTDEQTRMWEDFRTIISDKLREEFT